MKQPKLIKKKDELIAAGTHGDGFVTTGADKPNAAMAAKSKLQDKKKAANSLDKAKKASPAKAAKMVDRFARISKSKKKTGPMQIKLEAIFTADPSFNKYASLASSLQEPREKIQIWFRSRRLSAERERIRNLAAVREL